MRAILLLCATLATATLLAQPALVPDPSFRVSLAVSAAWQNNSPNTNEASRNNWKSWLMQPDGGIILEGDFESVQGRPRRVLARAHPNGVVDDGFTPDLPLDPNPAFSQLAGVESDGRVLVWVPDGARRKMVRLDSRGRVDPTFQGTEPPPFTPPWIYVPGKEVMQSDGKRIVADVDAMGSVRRLNPDGSPDPSFAALLRLSPDEQAIVRRLVRHPDGKIAILGVAVLDGGDGTERVRPLTTLLNADGTFNRALQSPPALTSNFRSNQWGFSSPQFQPDGKILLGGFFRTWPNESSSQIIRLNPDWSWDPTFTPVIPETRGGEVQLLERSGSKTILAGRFASVNGHFSPTLARLNADGTVDTGFVADPATPVMRFPGRGSRTFIGDIVDLSDGKILLHGAGGPLVRVNSNGALDEDFKRFDVGGVFEGWGLRAIIGLQRDGRILIQKILLEEVHPEVPEWFVGHLRLARLSQDGSIDGSFAPEFRKPAGKEGGGAVFRPIGGGGAHLVGTLSPESSEITALVVQPDDKIVVAGEFTEVNRTTRYGIARLDADGSLDTSFDAGTTLTNLAETVAIKSLAVDAKGRILVGGYFFSWNGRRLALGLVRLLPDGSLDQSFVADPAGLIQGFEDNLRAVREIRVLSNGTMLVQFSGDSAALVGEAGRTLAAFGDLDGNAIMDAEVDGGGGLVFAGRKHDVQSGEAVSAVWRQQFVPVLRNPAFDSASGWTARLGGVPGVPHRIEASADLVTWQTVTNVTSTTENLPFTDPEATTSSRRFYRAVAE